MSLPANPPVRRQNGRRAAAETVAGLAAERKLPERFLREVVGLTDLDGGGVAVPYRDERGGVLYVKRRGVPGSPRFSVPAGQRQSAYGLNRPAGIGPESGPGRGVLFVTEGESDCWPLWHCGQRAIGIPGAGGCGCLTGTDLDGAADVCVVPDNDAAGGAFAEAFGKKLREIGYAGRAAVVRLPDGLKDLSDLWQATPDRAEFLRRLFGRVAVAAPIGAPVDRGGDPSPSQAVETVDDIPTLEDAEAQGATHQWLWKGWLLAHKVNGLAGTFGCGKTRLSADLIRRITSGLEWPDGQPMTARPDSRFLLVPADYQHSEMVEMARQFGFDMRRVYLNAMKDNATGVDLFNTTEALARLESRIRLLRPLLVIVDPIAAATANQLSHCSAEDVTRLYHPLQRMAAQYETTFLVLLHQNKEGTAYGRHATGKFRVEMQLTKVARDGDDRYRLEVTKSCDKLPPALGASQSSEGWTFDGNPPGPPSEPGQSGRAAPAIDEARGFLLARCGAAETPQVELLKEWKAGGKGDNPFFRARDLLLASGDLVDGERVTARGKTLKTLSRPPLPRDPDDG